MALNDRDSQRDLLENQGQQAGDDSALTGEIVNSDQIDQTLKRLATQTSYEMVTFAPGGAYTPEQISATQARNSQMYERGIHSRTIYLSSVRNHKPTLEHIRWLNDRGSEVRTVPTLPLRMIIADRKIAVVPRNLTAGMDGLIIHRGPAVVTALQRLFEMTWDSATTLGLTIPKDGFALSAEQRAILEQLALGKTDKEIGKVMGTSERTVRRKVGVLMEILNAENRFEAAYKAVKRDWI